MASHRASWLTLAALALLPGCDEPPGAASGQDGGHPAADRPDGGDGAAASDSGATPDRATGGGTRLHVRVSDSRTAERVPATLTLWDSAGQMVRFGNPADPPFCSQMGGPSLAEIGTGGALATWHGIALWNGEAVIPVGLEWIVTGQCGSETRAQKIPFGSYRLIVSRGLEYELNEYQIDLAEDRGTVFLDVALARTVSTVGYFAADMHVHTSGSNDSSVSGEDRIKTEAAVGIEVVVSSDHNFHTDLGEPIRKLWPDPAFPAPIVSVVGNEASANYGHFNVMPVIADPTKPGNGAIPYKGELEHFTPQTLLDRLHAFPTAPLIQMNHTRLGFGAYFDSDSCGAGGGWKDLARPPACPLDFEAMEVLSGFLACDTRIHRTLADWYALLGFGVVTTATGNSDTHGTSQILGGFPRTYIRVAEDSVRVFDEAELIDALRGRRAVATTGPFITLRVDDRVNEGELITNVTGTVRVNIRMQAASWIVPDEVRLKVNGQTVRTWPLAGSAAALFEVKNESLAVASDAFITAEVEGKQVLPPWMVGEYLTTKKASGYDCPPGAAGPGMIPFAVTNPVLIDADGDGRFRAVNQPITFPPAPDVWIPSPFPEGPPDCDPTGRPLR